MFRKPGGLWTDLETVEKLDFLWHKDVWLLSPRTVSHSCYQSLNALKCSSPKDFMPRVAPLKSGMSLKRWGLVGRFALSRVCSWRGWQYPGSLCSMTLPSSEQFCSTTKLTMKHYPATGTKASNRLRTYKDPFKSMRLPLIWPLHKRIISCGDPKLTRCTIL